MGEQWIRTGKKKMGVSKTETNAHSKYFSVNFRYPKILDSIPSLIMTVRDSRHEQCIWALISLALYLATHPLTRYVGTLILHPR